jgi:heme/copper-type cytochrome/quinol oxidase subunit 4
MRHKIEARGNTRPKEKFVVMTIVWIIIIIVAVVGVLWLVNRRRSA